MSKNTLLVPIFVLLTGCGSAVTDRQALETPVSDGEAEFRQQADNYYASYLKNHPTGAARLGYHEYDGKLPDLSPEALTTRSRELAVWLKKIGNCDPSGLSETARLERAVLISRIGLGLFDLNTRRQPWRNPMYYVWYLNLVQYVSRDYKPLEERARSVIDIADGAPALLSQAENNLEEKLPRTWIETAQKQVKGMISFVRKDVPGVFGEISDPTLKTDLNNSLEKFASALEGYAAFLGERLKTATEDYALGEESFLAMLAIGQGIERNVDQLDKMARADLERNLAALEAAAKEIDPNKTVAEVVQLVIDDKPDTDKVLAEAEAQAVDMRKFLLDKDIVSIPGDDVAAVRESPPFMRWNAASLNGVGPFEKKKMASYYYITPPDPDWSAEEQRAYVPGKNDLLFITIHELWPGHFLHFLHKKRHPSKIMKTFWSYTMGEGWAHYTEEMMWDQGVQDGDPKAHVGQLLNALLRNVRFISAIGLHAKAMSVDESAELFRTKAYCDEANARQQAYRGTFDPMYLSYTLGKLLILELREDWKKKVGDAYSLKTFHDKFLSYGAAPIPAIREAMMGD